METRVLTGYANARVAVKAAFSLISGADHLPPVEQAAGAFALFAALCERLQINPSDAAVRGKLYLKDGDIAREVSALRDYIEKEIPQ